MRYTIAAVISILLVIAGTALGGAGHGWVAGGFGCFALAPVAFLTVANGLGSIPSLRIALAALAGGLVTCVGVAFAMVSQGSVYLHAYVQATAPAGPLIGGAAYIGWLVIAVLVVAHSRSIEND